MKICPQCQTSYTDDTLRFCLQDGTPLNDSTFSDDAGEQETVLSPRQTEKVHTPVTDAQSQAWTQSENIPPSVTPKKSKTASIVVITALLTLLVAGAVATGIWFYLRGERNQIARNTNAKPVNTVVPNASKTNQSPNANTSPTATPTPKPTLHPKEVKNIQSDVENVVDDWKDALENLDLDAHLGNYADTVDYYKAGKTGIGAVRADKQRAFEAYSNIDIDISNLKITPDETGEKAVAVFDKEWKFESEDGNSSTGKVRQELQFVKIAGKWRISGEKDLQVYYTGK